RLFRRFFDVPSVEIDEHLLFVGKLRVGRALLPFSTGKLVYLSSELTGQGTPHTASPTRGGGEGCRSGSASARHRGRRGRRHRCSACRREAPSGGRAEPQPPGLREEKYGSLSNCSARSRMAAGSLQPRMISSFCETSSRSVLTSSVASFRSSERTEVLF